MRSLKGSRHWVGRPFVVRPSCAVHLSIAVRQAALGACTATGLNSTIWNRVPSTVTLTTVPLPYTPPWWLVVQTLPLGTNAAMLACYVNRILLSNRVSARRQKSKFAGGNSECPLEISSFVPRLHRFVTRSSSRLPDQSVFLHRPPI